MITAEKALADLDTLGLDAHATERYLHGLADQIFAPDKPSGRG